MDSSSDDSSSSDSSVEHVEMVKKEQVDPNKKPSLINRETVEAQLGDLLNIQLCRKDFCEHITHPFLSELVKDTFVRVVYTPTQYRCCRVIGLAQADKSYHLPGSGASQTRVELICQFGKFSRKINLKLISNSPISFSEFNMLKKAYDTDKVPFML